MRRSTRFAVALTAVAVSGVVLSGCSGSSSSSGSGSNTSLTIGVGAEPTVAPDPIVDGSLAGFNYYYNEFDQLTDLNAKGAIEPDLATKWTHNADFTQWTFTLRKGVKFSNGEPLKASDVVFTYDKVLATPSSDNLGYMGMLKSVSAPNDSTVVFDLNTPFSPWPSITTVQSIVPETVYTKLGSAGFAKAPVGSGPYEFVSYTRGVSYVLKRNPHYWGTEPSVAKLTFQTVADQQARLNGVTSGSLGVALIAPNQVGSITKASGATDESLPSNGVTFLGVNTTKGVLADPKVRQAIWHAIDTKQLVKSVLNGRGAANDQIVAPNVAGYVKGLAGPDYDPAAAKKLLQQAGYNGEPITFDYATNGRIPMSTQIAQAIAGYLQAVGIKVNLVGMDQSTLSNMIYGTVNADGIYLNTWAPSTMDGDMPAANLFDGGQNDYLKSPVAAALVQKQRTVDGAARVAVFQQLAENDFEQASIIPLFTPTADYAVGSGITWTPRADGEYVIDGVRVAG
jgi:peptide/nickel transport system substrate-binding protein